MPILFYLSALSSSAKARSQMESITQRCKHKLSIFYMLLKTGLKEVIISQNQ